MSSISTHLPDGFQRRPRRLAGSRALLSVLLCSVAAPALAVEPWIMVEKFTFDAESLGTRAQGITTDGTNWYFSGGGSLQIADGNFEPTLNNFHAIVPSLENPSPGAPQGLNHIGDIDYANGLLYIALDSDVSGYNTPVIATYNASDLSYTGNSYVLTAPHGTHDIASWVAVDVAKGLGYGMAYDDATELSVYNLADWSFKEYIPLSQTINEAQGGKILDGWMYLATNDDTQAIYRANIATGEVEQIANISSPFSRETEGLSFGDTVDGKSLYILNRERLEDDFSSHAYMGLYRHLRPTGNALSGEIHADIQGALVEDSRFMRDAADRRIRAAFDAIGAAQSAVVSVDENGMQAAAGSSDGVVIWTETMASTAGVDGAGDAAGFDRSTGGFVAGVDAPIGDWRVGVLAGYGNSSFDVEDRNSHGTSDNFNVGVYGGTQFGALSFRTGAIYGLHDVETTRNVIFPAFSETLTANYRAMTAQAFAELGYSIEMGQTAFEPFINLALVHGGTDGFSEAGGTTAALTSDGETTNTAYTTIGVRASTDVALGESNLTVHGMVGWQHAYDDVTPGTGLAFGSGASFTAEGAPIATDSLAIEAGFDFAVSPMASLGASYSGQIASGTEQHAVKASFKMKM